MGAYTVGPKSKFNGMKSTTKVYEWQGSMISEQALEKEELPGIIAEKVL
jgi:hypothetical protein